jgi:hypothetical protein
MQDADIDKPMRCSLLTLQLQNTQKLEFTSFSSCVQLFLQATLVYAYIKYMYIVSLIVCTHNLKILVLISNERCKLDKSHFQLFKKAIFLFLYLLIEITFQKTKIHTKVNWIQTIYS